MCWLSVFRSILTDVCKNAKFCFVAIIFVEPFFLNVNLQMNILIKVGVREKDGKSKLNTRQFLIKLIICKQTDAQ